MYVFSYINVFTLSLGERENSIWEKNVCRSRVLSRDQSSSKNNPCVLLLPTHSEPFKLSVITKPVHISIHVFQDGRTRPGQWGITE
ncbi:hypothetical protein CEXT_491861 [Caerostris extrusa]|uniref:Uncharacterized protein n=1 Tax=Caerostris extrusa TaxID=172846 RepID=A0AAV4USQ3_CAEEX|nr:hypothetical protein CEXT_491861 [Caerostris extrusa]